MPQPHKHAKIIKAWANGEEIEFKMTGSWIVANEPNWSKNIEYRIKPKPRCVPFTINDSHLLRGSWIRYKDNPKIELQIISIAELCITAGDGLEISYEELVKWKFLDDTPCGKIVIE